MDVKKWIKLLQLKLYNKLFNSKKLKHVSINGHPVSFIKGEEMVHAYREIYKYDIYNFKSNRADPLILDCGAHIGISIIYFKQLYPEARVIAFEPDPESFELLKKNTGGMPAVQLEQKAIWTHDRGVLFHQSGDMSSHIVNDGNEARSVRIPSTSLRNYLTGPIDMLKMDIEGAEMDVLEDCKDRLHLVKYLFVEFHGHSGDPGRLEQLLSLLKEYKLDYYIKLAADKANTPFVNMFSGDDWNIQLNIFCVNNNFKTTDQG